MRQSAPKWHDVLSVVPGSVECVEAGPWSVAWRRDVLEVKVVSNEKLRLQLRPTEALDQTRTRRHEPTLSHFLSNRKCLIGGKFAVLHSLQHAGRPGSQAKKSSRVFGLVGESGR